MLRQIQNALLLIVLVASLQGIDARAQTQKIEGGCGANIASVDKSSHVNINIDCAGKTKDYLSFDYSRLFGAFEVPLLMEFIPGRPTKREFEGYRTFITSRGRTEWIADDLYNFWRDQLPYKGAVPLLTPMWKDLSGKSEVGHSIAWRSAVTRNERICFYRSLAIDDSGSNYEFLDKYFHVNSEKYCKNREAYDQRIGFTFLVIENASDSTLTDARITFRQSYLPNRARADFHNSFSERFVIREILRLPSNGDPVALLTSKFGRAQDQEFSLARSAPDFLLISKIMPRQKLIAITDVFVANENNLPASYIYGAYVFEDLQFSVEGAVKSIKIRPPSLEGAARIQVPYGWFAQ